MSIRRNWRRWQALSAEERRQLLLAFLLLPATVVALRLIGFRRCQSVLSRRLHPAPSRSASGPESIKAIARMVRAAARRCLLRPNCLPQALVLWWLLERQGITSDMRIGVRKQADRLEAHAWVESQGQALEDATLGSSFVAFPRTILPLAA